MVKSNNSWTGSYGVFWSPLLAWKWSRAQGCPSKESADHCSPLVLEVTGFPLTLLGEVIEWVKLLSIVFFWGVEIRKVWVGRNDGKTSLPFSFGVTRLGSLPCCYGCQRVLFAGTCMELRCWAASGVSKENWPHVIFVPGHRALWTLSFSVFWQSLKGTEKHPYHMGCLPE